MTDTVAGAGVVFPHATVSRTATIPDPAGLMAEFWLGVDAATSKKNRAYGGSDLIDLSGGLAPTYSSNYLTVNNGATLGASAGLDSTINAPGAVTIAVLQRQSPTGGKLRVFGTDVTAIGGNGAAGSYYSFWNGAVDGSTDQAHVAYGSTDTAFHLVVGVGVIGQVGNIYTYTGGVLSTDVATRTDVARSSTTVKLGGFISNQFQGSVDVAWAAMFNLPMTPAAIANLYASIKAWGTARGLTVS